MWNDDVYKRFGWRGALTFLAGSVAGILGTVVVQHYLDNSVRPAALVIKVIGAEKPHVLRLDNRPTDAPDHKSFFRLDGVMHGEHLVELFTTDEAVFSRYVDIAGGVDNLVEVDLRDSVSLPWSTGANSLGWVHFGTTSGGRITNGIASQGVQPSVGTRFELLRPAFMRVAPARFDQTAAPFMSDAFARLPSGQSVQVNRVEAIGEEIWVQVRAE